jgi:ATP-dependent Clp protease ATP-binding subunit ClpA
MADRGESVADIFWPNGRLRRDLLAEPAAKALDESARLARQTGWDRIRSPHVFMGLLTSSDPGIAYWGSRLGADLGQLLEQFLELFQQRGAEEIPVLLHREFLSDNVISVLRAAKDRAVEGARTHVTTLDLLISILTAPRSFIAECFEHFGITAAKLTEWAVIAEYQGCQGVKKV